MDWLGVPNFDWLPTQSDLAFLRKESSDEKLSRRVAELELLPMLGRTALVDAVERWWLRVGSGENKLKLGEALK